jgi:hypothetical protein
VSKLVSLASLKIANKLIALKNANDMLKDIVKAMDKNGDEVIQYEGMFGIFLGALLSSSCLFNVSDIYQTLTDMISV